MNSSALAILKPLLFEFFLAKKKKKIAENSDLSTYELSIVGHRYINIYSRPDCYKVGSYIISY